MKWRQHQNCQNTINDKIISSLEVYVLIFHARRFL